MGRPPPGRSVTALALSAGAGLALATFPHCGGGGGGGGSTTPPVEGQVRIEPPGCRVVARTAPSEPLCVSEGTLDVALDFPDVDVATAPEIRVVGALRSRFGGGRAPFDWRLAVGDEANPPGPVLAQGCPINPPTAGGPFCLFAPEREALSGELDWRDTALVGVLVRDACGETLEVECPVLVDDDSDGARDAVDNCRARANDQTNADGDPFGDACDNCAGVANADQANSDPDAFGNVCDNCPNVANDEQTDRDGDRVGDACDDNPTNPNVSAVTFHGARLAEAVAVRGGPDERRWLAYPLAPRT